MTNEEKLEALKGHLRRGKVRFRTDVETEYGRLDIFVPWYRIAVMITKGRESDAALYSSAVDGVMFKRRYHPIFIRDTDTEDFVIEKFDNCKAEVRKVMNEIEERIRRRERGLETNRLNMLRHEEKMRIRAEKAARVREKSEKRNAPEHSAVKMVMRQRRSRQ